MIKSYISQIGVYTLLLFAGCSKQTEIDQCLGTNYDIQYSSNPAVGGIANGNITMLTPRGDTLSYSINNGSPQASPIFTGLAAGSYLVKVINKKGCSDTLTITLPAYGAKYANVKELITGYCGPCHLNGGNSGNKNFDSDAAIVASWDRINARCVNGTPTFMPQNGQLTIIDKQKITDWVNAGHRQSD